MLRGFIICPDAEVAERLQDVAAETNQVAMVRDLDRYPSALELMRYVRAHAPHVLFVSTESLTKAAEIAETIDREAPGLQVVAIGRTCDPSVLLDVMRIGIREFLALPFNRQALYESMLRVEEQLQRRPPAIDATDLLFAFLPSKQGVGTSTVALNTAIALSRHNDNNTLLMDLDLSSGIIGFMLKLNNVHSVIDAAENSHQLDESLWPQLVSHVSELDVLHSGRLNTEFRIEPSQLRHLIEFARRHYRSICVDLSGNMERYSIEVMHEAKRIFLVCTPEIPSLHLAREKFSFLQTLDLGDRVSVLLNRAHKRSLISAAQIEELLGVPVYMSFPNDYQGVHRSLQAGKSVDDRSELGKQFNLLAQAVLDRRNPEMDTKKRFVEYFSILPARYSLVTEGKKPGG